MVSRGPHRWWVYWAVSGVLAVGGYALVVSYDTWQRRVYGYFIGVAVVAAMIVGVRIHRPVKPVIWYLLAAGQALGTLGNMSVGFGKHVLGREIFPYFSDCLGLMAYAVFAGALFVLIRGTSARWLSA